MRDWETRAHPSSLYFKKLTQLLYVSVLFLCCRSEHWVLGCAVHVYVGPPSAAMLLKDFQWPPTLFLLSPTTPPLCELGAPPKSHWKLRSAFHCGPFCCSVLLPPVPHFTYPKDCFLSVPRNLWIHLSYSLFCQHFTPFRIYLQSFSLSQEEGGTTWVVSPPSRTRTLFPYSCCGC